MKTNVQNLILLFSLAGLAGCGAGGTTSATLEVSRAFATTNTTFGGGLIISGKNLSTGKSFSQGLTASKEFRTSLEKGKWKIVAVGWDGGGSSGTEKLFAGVPYCGSVEADLSSDQETVNLTINTTNCNQPEFTGGFVDGSGQLRIFGGIITCNTFLNPTVGPSSSGAINTHYVAPGTGTDYFCSGIAPDLQSEVKAVKIHAINKLPGQVIDNLGMNTGCMQGLSSPNHSVIYPSNASNPYGVGYELRLPLSNVPFVVTTYKDTTCTEQLATYPFKEGIVAGNPAAFDHLVHDRGSMDVKLLLPGNDMRRAKSALVNLMPFFKRYNSGTPEKFETVPSNYSSLGYPAFNGETKKIVMEEESDCGDSFGYSGNITATCSDLGDRVEITYTGTGVGAGDFTFYNPGPVARRTVYLNVEESTFTPILYHSQKELIRLLGDSGTDSNDTFFDFNKHDDDKKYGVLSLARQMLSASGAGGVLGIPDDSLSFTQACNNLIADKTVTIFNYHEMKFESYRVNIHNSKVSGPTNYMCRTGTLSASDCDTTTGALGFKKRMLIYDHKQSTITPAITMEFSCTGYVGRLESNFIRSESLFRTNTKKIVSWNTQTDSSLAQQRIEFMEWSTNERLVSTTWTLQVDERRMGRLQKNATDNYDAWIYRFAAVKGASNFAQQVERYFFKTEGTTKVCFLNQRGTPVLNSQFNFILQNSEPLLDDGILGTEVPDDGFMLTDSYPQTQTTCSTPNFIALPSGNSSDLLDGSLEFQLGEFNTDFTAKFGGTFYTAP